MAALGRLKGAPFVVIIGLVLVSVAAAVHIFIFYLESIAWTGTRARRVFGIGTVEEAAAQKQLAFNQGFYNLFLAVTAIVGVALYGVGLSEIGAALVFAGAGSMVAASLVLLLSSRDKTSAALKQGALPAVGLLAFTVGLVS